MTCSSLPPRMVYLLVCYTLCLWAVKKIPVLLMQYYPNHARYLFFHTAFIQLISTSQPAKDAISNVHKSSILKQKCLFPPVSVGFFYTSCLDHFPGSCILSTLLQLITYIWWPPLRALLLIAIANCYNIRCLSLTPRSY